MNVDDCVLVKFSEQYPDLSLVDKMWTKIWSGGQQCLPLGRS